MRIKTCPFGIPKKGIRILWEITYRCNLRCKHCFIFDNDVVNIKEKELKTEEIFSLVDKLTNVKEIWLSGGEPLLRSDLVKVVKYMSGKGINVSLSTNGTLLDKIKILKLISAGITYFNLSLDSVNERVFDNIRGKGSFKKVIRAIENLKELKAKYGFSCVVTKNNFMEILEIVKFCNEINCSAISFYPPIKQGRSKENEDNLDRTEIEKLKIVLDGVKCKENLKIDILMLHETDSYRKKCYGYRFFTVTPYGQIGPCPWYCKKDNELLVKFTNFEKNIKEIELQFKDKNRDLTICPFL